MIKNQVYANDKLEIIEYQFTKIALTLQAILDIIAAYTMKQRFMGITSLQRCMVEKWSKPEVQ
jgi:hypothetical protein